MQENALLSRTVRSITLTVADNSRPLLFEPGQYAAISLHDKLRPTANRCFSIASSPTDRSNLEFSARISGEYTAAFERLKKGDEIAVRGPFGHFILKEQYDDVVFFAGGIGITPFMSMMRYAHALRLQNKMHLVYSCRSQNDIPYFAELVELLQHNPNLRITFTISEGSTERLKGLEVVVGRIDNSRFESLGFSYATQTYMMCGPSGFVHAMQGLLKAHGVPHNRIFNESFTQGTGHASSTLVSWPANAYALSGLSLIVAGFFVVGSDLVKTLPELQASYEPDLVMPAENIAEFQTNTPKDIQAITPQVDTNIKQEPVVENVVKVVTVPVETLPAPTPTPAPKPVVVQAPTPAPSPTPTPTVTTKAKPKTRTS